MFSKAASFLALLSFISGTHSAENNFTLYAYGDGIKPGLQLFYGDGQAYVGLRAPSFVAEAVNVTLTPADDDTTKFVARPERTMDWPSEPTLFIDITEGAMNPVGFVKGNETVPHGTAVSGFGLYGGWAFHKNAEASIEMKFLATPTNETDVYLVKWNSGGTKSEDDVSIALRTLAPTTITD